MSKFLDQKISECHARLRDVHKQIETLSLRAASIQGELRAYESVRDQSDSFTLSQEPVDASIFEKVPSPLPKSFKLRKSRLSPIWQAVFKELVSTHPGTLSRASIEETARKFGPISASFRTALWHHVNRGYVDELDGGLYRANQTTAFRAGVPWNVGENTESQNEFNLGEALS
jgi:hypothetical protein